jgi:hypothetical protein
MPAIAAAPFVLKDATFLVAADGYEQHISSVRFDPTQSTITWQAIVPEGTFTDTASPSWTCTIAYAQDWTTTNSFSQYLLEHAGEKKTVVFSPQGDDTGAPVFTADLMLASGPIGGDVNTVQVGSVTLGVVGTPELTHAP